MQHANIHTPAAATESLPPSALSAIAQRLRRVNTIKRAVLGMRQWRTHAIERWLNIHTAYRHPKRYRLDTQFADAVPNESVDYVLLRKLMKPLMLSPHDVLYDVGCGVGRVLCVFARCNIRKCIGIEFDPQLAEIAEHNSKRLRGRRAEIEIHCGDAAAADYSDGTIYWFFNPFGSHTLHSVMDRIERSVSDEPRLIRIVYVNPLHEDVLKRFDWLERTGFVQSPFFGAYGASYWRSTGHFTM
jgi:precorrin-6B methylase 2